MTSAGGSILGFSPHESARFGLRIFRGYVEAVDAARIAEEIERERVDVAILRLPATAMAGAEALRRYGFDPIVADTQVVYGIELGAYARAWSDSSIALHLARREDAAVLDRMARAIFRDYESHYTANPLFAREKIVDGYAEWAARHVESDDGSAAWLVEQDGVLAGFSCYRIDSVSGTAVGVLNGVLPAARGRGVYRGMLHKMLDYFTGIGLRHFEIATQTHNTIVQRVWTSSNLAPRATRNTLHVNALRGRSEGSRPA